MSRFRAMSVDTAAGRSAAPRAVPDTDRGLPAAAMSTAHAVVAASAARSALDPLSDTPDTAASRVDAATSSFRVAALGAVHSATVTHRAVIPEIISGTHRLGKRRVPLINRKGHFGDYPAFV